MKKLLASALSILMAGAMLTACGDSDSSTSSKKDSSKADSTAESTTEDESKEETTTTTEATTEAPAESTPDESEPEPAADDLVYDPEATSTVINLENPDTGAWANCFGEDYIDYRTLPRDTDLTFTVTVKLSDTFLSMLEADPDGSAGLITGSEQIGFAPTSMTPTAGWKHLGEELGYVTGDFPVGRELMTMEGASDGTYMLKAKVDKETGEPKTDKEGNIKYEEDVYLVENEDQTAELYEKADGFIKWNDCWKEWGDQTQTCTFTLSKEAVNFILDSIAADAEADPENVFGGILFQCSGNFEVLSVEINYGNILTASQINSWLEAPEGEEFVWGDGEAAAPAEDGGEEAAEDGGEEAAEAAE